MCVELRGLRVRNDNRQQECNREWALNIAELSVACGEQIYVLADNYNGKSPLGDALYVLVNSPQTNMAGLDLPNIHGRPEPIHVDFMRRAEHVSCRKQGGTTDEEFAPLQAVAARPDGRRVLNYADDPLRSGRVIDLCHDHNLTLMIGNDPDRLEHALSHFVAKNGDRILWLAQGEVFWDGSVAAFRNSLARLFSEYDAHEQMHGYCGARKDFRGAIARAVNIA